MTDLHAQMAENAADVERALEALLTVDALNGPGRPPGRLVAAMRHGALGGGKRLRPLLVRQAAAVFGAGSEGALAAGVAVELVHCYSLIHDDLPAMDDDDLRRGKPTVHRAFDEAAAILAGDALLTLAFQHLAQRGGAHAAPLVVELGMGAGTGGMAGGQMRDLEGEVASLDEGGIGQMQAMKTGALIRAAVRMGAIVGGASADQLMALTRYAEAAGRAFQLADDILDVTSSPEALGKATKKDAGRGKQTLVSLIGLDAARRRLDEMVQEAVAALAGFGEDADGLRATVRYFAERDR